MFFKAFAASVVTISMGTAAIAQGSHTSHSANTFKGARIHSAIGQNRDTSKDAILPDGTINVDPTVTGSVSPSAESSSNRSGIRIICDSSPNTSEMRSNTFDAAAPSVCP